MEALCSSAGGSLDLLTASGSAFFKASLRSISVLLNGMWSCNSELHDHIPLRRTEMDLREALKKALPEAVNKSKEPPAEEQSASIRVRKQTRVYGNEPLEPETIWAGNSTQ